MSFAFLPTWLQALLFVVLTCAVALAAYAVARRLLLARVMADTHELAASVLFRIGALHALILALAFALGQANYTGVLASVDAEATALSDVYDNLARYRSADLEPLRSALRSYVDIVATSEWQMLATGKLSAEAWDEWERVYEGVLDLEPATARQTSLRAAMIGDLETVSDARKRRELATVDRSTDIFAMAAAVGLVLVMMAYFPFRPGAANMTLLLAYAGFTGLVFFFILAMSNPFAPPVALKPEVFRAIAQEWSAAPGG